MELNLSPDPEAKLARIANQRGCDAQAVAREAIERVVNYDEWFIGEVDPGLAQIERGNVLTHEAVGDRLEKRLTKHSHIAQESRDDAVRVRDGLPRGRPSLLRQSTMAPGELRPLARPSYEGLRNAAEYSHRQAGCWQPQRSSVR